MSKQIVTLSMRCFFTGIFGLLLNINVMAQEKTITGKVVDKNQQGIPGVNIVVKGSTNGTITDTNGFYTISAQKGDILQYSFIGFQSQDITVGEKSNYNVVLKEELTGLDEVVVVGYGVQKKSDLTGAVSTVKPDELVKRDVATVNQALQGQIAGVTVTQSSGTPGASPTIRVRGIGTLNNADPLYVVDGMMVDNINFLNARDIESLQVLKDASASAIYGSRGANGVIIITTKKGSKGHSRIKVNAYYGIQDFGHTPALTNASEWAMLNNEARLAAGQTPRFDDPASLGKGTDWLAAITNKNAPIQSYDISFSGGNDKNNYFVSGTYLSQTGIVKKTDYDRLSFRVNSEHQIKKWLRIGENISISNSNQGVVTEDDEWNNILITPLDIEPTTPVHNADGSYGASLNQVINPVAALDNRDNNTENFRVIGDVFANIDITKNLSFRSTFGVQNGYGTGTNYQAIYYVSSVDGSPGNSLDTDHSKDLTIEWSNTLTYQKKFGEHHGLSAIAGTSFDSRKYTWDGSGVTGFPTDDKDYRVIDNAANANQASTYGSRTERNIISYLARVNYNFDEKYLFTANFRTDGASVFGSKNKWGYFPSFSTGWRINQENFMDGLKFISNLKLRAGWGQIGNETSITPYTQTTTASAGHNYVWGDKIVSGTAFESVGNDQIKWETSTTSNLGLDFGFLDNKISGTLEYYIKNTSDMILQVPVPGQTGIEDAPYQNAGKMKNTGIELSLQYTKQSGNFHYTLGGNFTTINNEVLSLGEGNEFILGAPFRDSGYVTRTVVGKSIANFYGLVAEGLFQNQAEIDDYYKNASGGVPGNVKPGDIKYQDVDGDGNPDYNFIGSPLPDFIYSFNGSIDYKGIDFSFLLNGVYGNDIYNGTDYYQLNSNAYFNLAKDMLNRWTGEGSTNNPRYARMNTADSNNTRISSRYVQDGSYLRIQNVQLGYTLPQSLTSRYSINKLRFYLSGQNLFTFTNYTGYDPEVGGEGLEQGLDKASYPVARTITFGLNLEF